MCRTQSVPVRSAFPRAPRLGLFAVVVLLLALTGQAASPSVGLAAGELVVTCNTGPYVVYDHNKPPAETPGVFVSEHEVCNTTASPLDDVVVYVGDGTSPGVFPETTFGTPPVNYALQSMDEKVNGDVSDATRSLGTVPANSCVWVYWMLAYPHPQGEDLDGLTLGFTVWGSAAGGITANTISSTVELRDQISASSNKQNYADYTLVPSGPYTIGQTFTLCFTNPEFGVVGNGRNGANDFWFQPVGNDTAFDVDDLRLVDVQASLKSNKCTGPPQPVYDYQHRTYYSTINDGDWDGDGTVEACIGSSQQVTGASGAVEGYCYTFMTLDDGASEMLPYQQSSSGSQQKYNGDYGTTTDITVNPVCSIALTKSADKTGVAVGDEVVFTVEYENLLSVPVGNAPWETLVIDDAIPTDTDYKASSASCPTGVACIVYYSTDGVSYTVTEPSPASTVQHLRFVTQAPIPADGVGSVAYTVVVQTNNGFTTGRAQSRFDSGPVCSESNTVTMTPVTLSYFEASRDGDTVRLEWSTETEVGNVGFDVFVETERGWRRLNETLIPSRVGDSVDRQDYVFEAEGVEGNVFRIEDHDIFSRTRSHGTFELGVAHGLRGDAEPIDWAGIRGEHALKAAERGQQRLAGATTDVARARSATAQASMSLLTSVKYGTGGGTGSMRKLPRFVAGSYPPFELHVDRNGLYRVTYEQLRDAGLDLAGVPVGDVALTARGEPVPITVRSRTILFGAGSTIEFIGRAHDSLYTSTNTYTLRVDQSLARRIAVDTKKPPRGNGAEPEPFYLETVTVENQRLYSHTTPNDDPWYDTRMLAYATPLSWSFAVDADGLVPGAAPATVSVGLLGITDFPDSPDHHVQVDFNGTQVADAVFDGLADVPITAELPSGLLQPAGNTLTLNLPADTGVRYDLVNLDRYGITYPRAFLARDGVLSFDGAGRRFRVEGLPSSSVAVYRVAGGVPTRLAGASVSVSGDGFSVDFSGTNDEATYMVSTVDRLLAPVIVPAPAHVDITSKPARLLMISHPDFVDGLEPLVAARRAQGYTVEVVDVEQVYAQFGFSQLDPQAIRDYVAFAAANKGAEYILIVGGDTFDYFDYLGQGAVGFVPSLYAQTTPVVAFAPVDPLYADIDGDNVPDLPIGRFPVRTSAELATLIDKTLTYEAATYGRSAVFAADARDELVSYRDHSESFVDGLPDGWTVQRAYVDDLGIAAAKQVLIDEINDGVALTSFVGHSSREKWSFGGLLSAGDVASLRNESRPTVVAQWGCWNTYYVSPNYETMAHKFLLSGDRGAAAVLGASALTSSISEQALGSLVVPTMLQPGVTIGQAIQDAKAQLSTTHPEMVDVLLGWTLLGDPTIVVEPQ